MRIENADTYGIFCYEVKNRFRCIVEVKGDKKLCYVASSCRLSNFLKLEGKKVLLLPKGKNANSTYYTLYAVKYRNSYTLLDLSLANNVIKEQIHRRYFSLLGRRKNVVGEKLICGYKADLFICDTNTIIEIKTVISNHDETVFPTVYSDRSLAQLDRVKTLLQSGYRFYYMFVALSPSVKKIIIDKDTLFYRKFVECMDCGMQAIACRLRTTEKNVEVNRMVEVKMPESI